MQGSAGGGWSYAGPQSAFRRPRARHGRHHERPGGPWRHHPLRRDVPGLLGLPAPVDPAGRPDGHAGDICVHARQHREWERTGPPISRWSSVASLRAIPGLIVHPAVRRQRDGRRLARRRRDAQQAGGAHPDAAERADPGPRALRAGGGTAAGGVHSGRCTQREAGTDPDRQRIGSGPDRGGAAEAAGAESPRAPGVHAELGIVRGPVTGVSRIGVAQGSPRPAGGGSRSHAGLAPVCRRPRRCHRGGPLRHFGPRAGGDARVWADRRARLSAGAGLAERIERGLILRIRYGVPEGHSCGAAPSPSASALSLEGFGRRPASVDCT